MTWKIWKQFHLYHSLFVRHVEKNWKSNLKIYKNFFYKLIRKIYSLCMRSNHFNSPSDHIHMFKSIFRASKYVHNNNVPNKFVRLLVDIL